MVAIRWRQCHSSESACLFVSALVCVSSDVDVFDVDVHWYLILEEECLLGVDTDDLSNGGTLAEGGAKIILFKRRVSSSLPIDVDAALDGISPSHLNGPI